jgi:hypothetical protein
MLKTSRIIKPQHIIRFFSIKSLHFNNKPQQFQNPPKNESTIKIQNPNRPQFDDEKFDITPTIPRWMFWWFVVVFVIAGGTILYGAIDFQLNVWREGVSRIPWCHG